MKTNEVDMFDSSTVTKLSNGAVKPKFENDSHSSIQAQIEHQIMNSSNFYKRGGNRISDTLELSSAKKHTPATNMSSLIKSLLNGSIT
jgi:hypothetical protein